MARRAASGKSGSAKPPKSAAVGANFEIPPEAFAVRERLPPLLIDEPGIYDDVAELDYHADPCPSPSLSRSVLKVLLDLTPAHAHAIHPKLGGTLLEIDGTADEARDFGTAAHSSFLQNKSIIRRLDFNNWQTNAAKEARRQAYADGEIPLLPRPYSRAMRLIDALEDFRAKTGAFTRGHPEQTLVWQEENGIWCRGRVDWLADDPAAPLWDLKTTAGRATLQAWSRICFEKGADVQDALYCRGLEMIRGEPPEPMHFCVVEQNPPYAIAVFVMAPQAREEADTDVRYGLHLWEECLRTGSWPGYPSEPQWVWPLPWISRAREQREADRKLARQAAFNREHPNAVGYVESGNFGG